ncbi:non-homologous end joining protein Ku [Saccharopolyspora sp. NPDC002376]
MATAIWKGHIAFGLVSIGVAVTAATESRTVAFRQIHRLDSSRIRQERRCEVEDKPVPWDEVAKGYQTPDGRIVQVTEEDLASLPLPTKRRIEVLEFVPANAVDPIYFSSAYYLGPADETSVRPYVLLRDTLAKSGRLAVTKVTLRNRERVAVLRVVGAAICLQTMLWPDEVRAPELTELSAVGPVEAGPQEMEMARLLVDSMSVETFDASQYRDEYREKLLELIDAKIKGREVEVPAPRAEEVVTPDLAEALQASLAAAKAGRPHP